MKLKLGTITKTAGLKGDVKVFSTTSLANKRYKKGNKVFIEEKTYTIKNYRKLNSIFDVVCFEEITTVDDAETLLKKDIYAEKDPSILAKNEFYFIDLIGLTIYFKEEPIGVVTSVEEFPAQITLKCNSLNKKEFFIPFIPQFINNIDLENKIINVNIIEGMI